jgi:hypothetical protein
MGKDESKPHHKCQTIYFCFNLTAMECFIDPGAIFQPTIIEVSVKVRFRFRGEGRVEQL